LATNSQIKIAPLTINGAEISREAKTAKLFGWRSAAQCQRNQKIAISLRHKTILYDITKNYHSSRFAVCSWRPHSQCTQAS